jgi:hypothetical protein
MQKQKPSKSQSVTGVFISSQIGLTEDKLTQIQLGSFPAIDEPITLDQVTESLIKIEQAISKSDLSEDDKRSVLKYLDIAKEETQQKHPDKELTAKSLKRVAETIKTTDETMESSIKLWKRIQPLLNPILGWLGEIASQIF